MFDKTSTITNGKPEVTDIAAYDDFDEGRLLQIAASAERSSEHPLGMSIVERAQTEGLDMSEPRDFQAVRGKGVIARIDGKRVLVGSRRLLLDYQIDPSPLETNLVDLENEAKTAMLAAVGDELAGVIAVADTLKEDSNDAIQALHQMSIQTAMITGDNARTAEAIARKVGIDHVLAEIAMATSSVTVVSNANRLRKIDIRPEYRRKEKAIDTSESARQPVRAGLQELH